MANQPRADGGFVGNAVFKRVGFRAANDLEFLFNAQRRHAHAHGGANVHHVGVDVVLIDKHDVFEHVLDFDDLILHARLLSLCRIVFRVFAQVAKRAGDLNLLRNFRAAGCFQVFQPLLVFFNALCGQTYFCHG